MVATMMSPNGQTRKTLASQIDRLDGLLDGLAEAINDTVVEAVKQAVNQTVQAAVEAAVKEVLINADLRKHLQVVEERTVPLPQQGWGIGGKIQKAGKWLWNGLKRGWNRVVALVCLVAHKAVEVAGSVKTAIAANVHRVSSQARMLFQMAVLLACGLAVGFMQFRKPLLIALGVGLAIGLGCYFAGPTIASLVSGLHSMALTLLVMGVQWFRRLGTGKFVS